MARNMRVGARDAAIGLVIPDMGNPFFGTVAGGIESAVRGARPDVIVGSSSETKELERSLVATFLARRGSSALLCGAVGHGRPPLSARRT
ncbi:hypothetical protein [Nonomuraea dietziae]|uniref:hypothetical protein n=1 Tax=Nonomuraea dietziae TaxID=65515 RepID=UPI0031DBD50C